MMTLMVKVLVIDDSRLMCLYLRRILEGPHVVEEWLPLSAMEIGTHILASAPDVVLTDYQMPGCNGATVARMIMKTRPDLPVIVITSSRDEEVAATLRKFQVADILHKPVAPAAVLAAVDRAVAGPGSH
jgi:CheY-like chemotaxis protein